MKRAAIAVALIAGLSMPCVAEPRRSAAETMDIPMWAREPIGGPFALIDHTGTLRTEQNYRGKLLLVYFGFTYCPDVCPTDLQNIGLALDQLGAAGDKVQPCLLRLTLSGIRRRISPNTCRRSTRG